MVDALDVPYEYTHDFENPLNYLCPFSFLSLDLQSSAEEFLEGWWGGGAGKHIPSINLQKGVVATKIL